MAGIEENTEQSRIGAAPSLPYCIALALAFGVALIATTRYFPPAQRMQLLECPLPQEPDTVALRIELRGDKLVAQCIPVSAPGAYGQNGRRI